MKVHRYGLKSPFLEWMGRFGDDNSQNPEIGLFTGYDVDVLLHMYACVIEDRVARQLKTTRELKAIHGLEVKTRSGVPKPDQREAFWHLHLSMRDVKPDAKARRAYTVRQFGWSYLSMSGTRPDNSDVLSWGRYDDVGEIQWRRITLEVLIDLMGFVRHPESLKLQPFHRHHGKREIYRTEVQPLGFAVPVLDVETY